MVGDGSRRAAVEARAGGLGVRNVRFVPPVPPPRMPELLSLLDAAVVTLGGAPVLVGARPAKMFELLAVGVPFVYAGRGEGAELARASGGALVVEPEDAPALAAGPSSVLAMDGEERAARAQQARRFVTEHFDRARIAADMERRLLDLVR
jgi:glycosyltransferase involved in cell wall biosynthesis